MTYLNQINIHLIDLIALIWFFIMWSAYSVFSETNKKHNLVRIMHRHRIRWMKQMIRREDRLSDIRIVANLLKSTTFFASTSIFIIGGMVAILGYGEHATKIIQVMPFAVETSAYMWLVKTMLLLVIFVYSFFKFTWVIRQFNYANVLLVSAPLYKPEDKDIKNLKKSAKFVFKISKMISNAGHHFNMGMRSYYFGLVALSWYISPILLILLSTLIVMVLYRREFRSKTLNLLE